MELGGHHGNGGGGWAGMVAEGADALGGVLVDRGRRRGTGGLGSRVGGWHCAFKL